MPFDALPDDDALDPYSARVAHAFERVGPAVAHIAALGPDHRGVDADDPCVGVDQGAP